MSWVAVGVGVVGAVGSYASAKEANKPKKGHTDQTTTQNPYMDGVYEGDIYNTLNMQRQLAAGGTPQIGPDGSLTYAGFGDRTSTGGDGGGGNGQSASYLPPGAHISASGKMVNSAGKAYNPARDGGPGSGGGGGNTPGSPPPPSKPLTSQQSAANIFNQVADAGLKAGNTDTIKQGRVGIGNVLNAEGQGGTGFQGYNPILDKLAQTLQGNVSDAGGTKRGTDLLNRFLNEDQRGDTGGVTGGPVGSGGSGQGSGGNGNYQNVHYNPSLQGNGFGSNSSAYAGVPDTMATQSYFGDQVRKIMDDKANDAELSALIDSMNADTQKGMFRDLATQDAAAQGSGRFGGDMWKGTAADTRYNTAKAELQNSAGVRVSDQQTRKARQLAALGDVNQRDQALLGANVQREGIAASERNASAASAASGAALAQQAALEKRSQDLSAIGLMTGVQQGNIGQLSGLGNTLSSNQLAAMGLIPGLEGIGLTGLGLANQAGSGFVDMHGQDVNASIARGQQSIAKQGLTQQASMWNAGQGQTQVNDYLRTIMGIGSMGGTSHTVGTNVQAGLGVSPTGAAIQGGVGAGLAAYGYT